MFVNRSFIPSHHHHRYQQDWLDPADHLLSSLALLDDDILPRIWRKDWMRDVWRFPWSELQDEVNWNDPNKFEAKLKINNFTPEEITVKVNGNNLLVEGKHEEKWDKNGHSYVSRQFTQRYTLVDDVDLEQLCSIELDDNSKNEN